MKPSLFRIIRNSALICLVLWFAAPVFALDVPRMDGPVNDLAKVMTESQREELRSYLNAVNDQTSVQIAVLTLPSLEGDSLERFSMKAAESWKLGQADTDNGALLLAVMDERALRIEVGYGLEGELTDIKSGLIIREVIIPYFQKGEYGAGLIAGARNMAGIATGNTEIVADAVLKDKESSPVAGFIVITYMLFFIFITVISVSRARRRGVRRYYRTGSFGGSHSSFGGGFSGGSSGGGGFSGGGGSFGGGGASGRW